METGCFHNETFMLDNISIYFELLLLLESHTGVESYLWIKCRNTHASFVTKRINIMNKVYNHWKVLGPKFCCLSSKMSHKLSISTAHKIFQRVPLVCKMWTSSQSNFLVFSFAVGLWAKRPWTYKFVYIRFCGISLAERVCSLELDFMQYQSDFGRQNFIALPVHFTPSVNFTLSVNLILVHFILSVNITLLVNFTLPVNFTLSLNLILSVTFTHNSNRKTYIYIFNYIYVNPNYMCRVKQYAWTILQLHTKHAY